MASSRVGLRIRDRGHARLALSGREPLDHRQHEGRGLAGAGLRDAQQITAGQNRRDGLLLNGRRLLIAGFFHGFQDVLAQREFAEFHAVPVRGIGSSFGLRCLGAGFDVEIC